MLYTMEEKIQLSENQLRIMELFTRGFNKEYYIREMCRLLGVSPRTAQLNLESLENLAVLESKERGKIRTYRLKENEISLDYLKITEIFKCIKFSKKDSIISEILRRLYPCVDGIGAVFGSYVKGSQKRGSDLDIFIAGKYNKKELEKVADLYNIHIDVKNYPIEIFENSIKKDILVKEVLEDHVIFKGAERFIDIVMKDGG